MEKQSIQTLVNIAIVITATDLALDFESSASPLKVRRLMSLLPVLVCTIVMRI